jgi:hypothetical protein
MKLLTYVTLVGIGHWVKYYLYIPSTLLLQSHFQYVLGKSSQTRISTSFQSIDSSSMSLVPTSHVRSVLAKYC